MSGYDDLVESLQNQIHFNLRFKDQLEEELGLYEVSYETLIDAAMEHAENIDTVTNPDTDPLEVWFSRDGSLVVRIPNEIFSSVEKTASQLDEDTKIEDCGFCREKTIHKKDDNKWHCIECGQPKQQTMPEEYAPPFLRNLPYGGEKEASFDLWKPLTIAQRSASEGRLRGGASEGRLRRSIIEKRNPRKLRRILRDIPNPEEQLDIEESANALAIDD